MKSILATLEFHAPITSDQWALVESGPYTNMLEIYLDGVTCRMLVSNKANLN